MPKQSGEGASGQDQVSKPKLTLRLYVAGTSPKSVAAIENLNKLLQDKAAGAVELEVIDIYQKPICAKDGQIVAIPTLVKELPLPLQKFIGDLSNTERVLAALELETV